MLFRRLEEIGVHLVILLITLIVLFGLLHAGKKWLPGGIGAFVGKAADLASPQGWEAAA